MPPTESRQATARVTRLAMTAIKGFSVEEATALRITEAGVVGDRAFFMADDAGRLLSATRTARFLPFWARFDPERDVLAVGRAGETVLARVVEPGEPVRVHFFGDRYATGQVVHGPWRRLLSDIAGRPVQLVRAADPLGGYDVHRVSLVSEASVRSLGDEHDGAPVDGRRFRMTVTVDGVDAFAEDTWAGSALDLGSCVIRVAGPVRRCAAVQKHPEGRRSGVDALRRIKDVRGVATGDAGRGLHLGVYAEVERPGVVRVGDPVRVRA